jgi:hypothetical protein
MSADELSRDLRSRAELLAMDLQAVVRDIEDATDLTPAEFAIGLDRPRHLTRTSSLDE